MKKVEGPKMKSFYRAWEARRNMDGEESSLSQDYHLIDVSKCMSNSVYVVLEYSLKCDMYISRESWSMLCRDAVCVLPSSSAYSHSPSACLVCSCSGVRSLYSQDV
jgi:hypothetical protein